MIRTVWFFFAGTSATFFFAGMAVLGTYLGPRNTHRCCDWAARAWGRTVLWVAGIKVVMEGIENFRTDAPQIVVSNHQSWFDVFTLAAVLPVRYRFVAKKELAEVPVFGRGWKGCGHVSVDRGNKQAAIDAMEQAWREVREDRLTMVLFPEGTRSLDGRLQRFKKGAFVLAVQGQVPIVPIAVLGSREIMRKGSNRIRSGTITVRIGDPIPTEGATIRDRNRLMKSSWDAIFALKGETEESSEGPPLPS